MGISIDFFKIDKRKWGKTKPLPFRKDYSNRDKFESALEDFHSALRSKCSILNEGTYFFEAIAGLMDAFIQWPPYQHLKFNHKYKLLDGYCDDALVFNPTEFSVFVKLLYHFFKFASKNYGEKRKAVSALDLEKMSKSEKKILEIMGERFLQDLKNDALEDLNLKLAAFMVQDDSDLLPSLKAMAKDAKKAAEHFEYVIAIR
jgi:hypothetical protein